MVAERIYRGPVQLTIPHNIMLTPAVSLPLAMRSTGLPIGFQLAAALVLVHKVLKLVAELEKAMPWADRKPSIYFGDTIG